METKAHIHWPITSSTITWETMSNGKLNGIFQCECGKLITANGFIPIEDVAIGSLEEDPDELIFAATKRHGW